MTLPPFEIPLRRRYRGRHAHPYDKACEVAFESDRVPTHRAEVDVKVGAA